MPARMMWNPAAVAQFTIIAPLRAHGRAAALVAGIGARKIRSRYSGNLARDVSRPKPIAPMVTLVGSSLRYAAMENWGGVIRARHTDRRGRRMLYIRGQRTGRRGQGTRSDYGGGVIAVVPQVVHKGKHYLEAMRDAYAGIYIAELRMAMPKGLRL